MCIGGEGEVGGVCEKIYSTWGGVCSGVFGVSDAVLALEAIEE